MKISYVHWVETDKSQHFAELPPCCSTTEVWLRIAPPARAWRSRIQGNKSEWSLSVIDQRGQFQTASPWKECSLNPSVRPVITSERLLKESLTPEIVPSEKPSREIPLNQPSIVSNAILNGKKVRRYELEFVRGNFLVKRVIFAHPRTRRLIRKERTEMDLSDGRQIQHTVFDGYVYNQRPAAGTFEMPKGKRIVVRDSHVSNADAWTTLPEKPKRQLLAVIERLDRGWREANFRQFASAWRFDKVPKTPKLSQWKLLIKQNHSLWAKWDQRITNVYIHNWVSRRIGSSTFTFSSKQRKTLCVEVMLTATSATTGKTWTGRAELFLQFFRTSKNRTSTRLKVVHWELPLLEIVSVVNPKILAKHI